jgi:hypothetical protein
MRSMPLRPVRGAAAALLPTKLQRLATAATTPRGGAGGSRYWRQCLLVRMMARRRHLSTGRAGTATGSSSTGSNASGLWEQCHIDAAFWRGAIGLAAVCGGGLLLGKEAVLSPALAWTVRKMRVVGISPTEVTDQMLLRDHLLLWTEAAFNVFVATPAFFFGYHAIHGQGVLVSAARSVTGTVRTAPMICMMCAVLGCAPPLLIGPCQSHFGWDYPAASSRALRCVMLGPVAVIEAL